MNEGQALQPQTVDLSGLKKNKDTAEVYVRHSADCKRKAQGRFVRNCDCVKWLYVYRNGKKEERSAKTRSWQAAEVECKKIVDSWNPEMVELKRRLLAAEGKQVTIEDAIRLHIDDMKSAGRANATVRSSRIVLGWLDYTPVGLGRKRTYSGGHLVDWIKTYNSGKGDGERLEQLHHLTPEVLTEWRATWRYNDLTAYTNWIRVVIFFNWCVRQGYLRENPAHKVTKMQLKRGNRTAVFTDEQYDKVIDATYLYEPWQMPPETRQAISQRVRTFIEVMRWSGCAIQDCLLLTPDKIDEEGVLRYSRIKTGVLAIVPLPERIVKMLEELPREKDSESGYYFRTQSAIATDIRRWEWRLTEVFSLAGITHVTTEIRTRKPHSHMFRDTFAVHYINEGVPLSDVARMCGHSNSKVTEKCYLPWVKSRQDAMIARVRATHKESEKRQAKGQVMSIRTVKRRAKAAVNA